MNTESGSTAEVETVNPVTQAIQTMQRDIGLPELPQPTIAGGDPTYEAMFRRRKQEMDLMGASKRDGEVELDNLRPSVTAQNIIAGKIGEFLRSHPGPTAKVIQEFEPFFNQQGTFRRGNPAQAWNFHLIHALALYAGRFPERFGEEKALQRGIIAALSTISIPSISRRFRTIILGKRTVTVEPMQPGERNLFYDIYQALPKSSWRGAVLT